MASTPITTAITEIIADLQELAGIAPITDYPAESIGRPWPRVFVYAQNGSWRVYTHDNGDGHATAITVQTIRVRVIANRSDLPKDMALLMPYADSVPLALLSGYTTDKFNGSMLTFGDARSPGANAGIDFAGPVADEWGGTPTIELQFSFNCSIEAVIP